MTLADADRPPFGGSQPAQTRPAQIRPAQIRPAQDARIPWPQWSVDTAFFWRSGADGLLRVLCCDACRRFAHPPTPRCRACDHAGLTPTPVSGDATVFSFTVNRQPFVPWLQVPYVLAIVALAEQEDLHLTTRLVDVEPDEVHVGQAVGVVFDHHTRADGQGGVEEIYLPLFSPRPVSRG